MAESESEEDRGAGISVCVVCRNEADKLGPCLASATWADELLVMDLESADGSAEVARAHGARVLSRAPHPVVEPLRNELAAQARGEWILALDPDERVSPGLAAELRRLAARADLDAIVVPRMNCDYGYEPSHPIQRHEPQLRMYRRAAVDWPEFPNRLPEVPSERTHRLPARDELVLRHERSRNVPEVLDRALRYAPTQAQAMLAEGQTFSARALVGALARQTDKELFHAEAWKDGVPGLLRAANLVAFKLYVWTAFWQAAGGHRTPEDDRYVLRLGRRLRLARRLLGLVTRLARPLAGRASR